jgi:hypothetical protein
MVVRQGEVSDYLPRRFLTLARIEAAMLQRRYPRKIVAVEPD